MISTTLEELARVAGGTVIHGPANAVASRISIDSRGVSPGTLFVALAGSRTDGHEFLADAFKNGAVAAIVSKDRLYSLTPPKPWPLIVVESPLRALQRLAKDHRRRLFEKVLAITGSNGKTIVKDTLRSILAQKHAFASPGSYNSQLGLPLSVLFAESSWPLGVFEAGVSQPGDMATLEDIIAPDFGILTNVGMAHFASFGSKQAIAKEKMQLFRHLTRDGWLLVPAEPLLRPMLGDLQCPVYVLGQSPELLKMSTKALVDDGQLLEMRLRDESVTVEVKTRSPEIVEDLHFAAAASHLLGVSLADIATALQGYSPSPTRLEHWTSPEGIRIINDTHSSDPISVRAALGAARAFPTRGRRIFAFAGMRELGAQTDEEYRLVGAHAAESEITNLVLLGDGFEPLVQSYKKLCPDGIIENVKSVNDLKHYLLQLLRPGDSLIMKGPRNVGMGEVARDIVGSIAQRCLWVDLNAIEENVARLRRHCGGAKILAMLKALAYGTDLVQLATRMTDIGIHDIGVSSTAEGVAVRRAGAPQNIYVFLPDAADVHSLLRYRLTPVVYSKELAYALHQGLLDSPHRLDVHLKVDTGMHRLGVEPESAVRIARFIRDSQRLRLTGICTHFAAADDPSCDAHTNAQISLFEDVLQRLRADGFDDLGVHAANTAGAIRFPSARYDMVRIGIGLYGICPSEAVRNELNLSLAIGVTSRIATIRVVKRGEAIGYNRAFTAPRDMKVGVVPFGYDDGMPWNLSERAYALVEGKPAHIVGRVSMDQLTLDLTEFHDVDVGAEVLLYGARSGHLLRPEDMAGWASSIPHELLIRLGRRVHRIFVEP